MASTRRRSTRNTHTPAKPSPLIKSHFQEPASDDFISTQDFGFSSKEEMEFLSQSTPSHSTIHQSKKAISQPVQETQDVQLNVPQKVNAKKLVADSPFRQGIEQFLQSPGPQLALAKVKAQQQERLRLPVHPQKQKQRQQEQPALVQQQVNSRPKLEHRLMRVYSAISLKFTQAKDVFAKYLDRLKNSEPQLQQFKRVFYYALGAAALVFTCYVLLNTILIQKVEKQTLEEVTEVQSDPADFSSIVIGEVPLPTDPETESPIVHETAIEHTDKFDQENALQALLQDAVFKLVDDRLMEKLADVVKQTALPPVVADYALESAGAVVVKELTSKTYISERLLADYQDSKSQWAFMKKFFGSAQDTQEIKQQINKWLRFHGPHVSLQSSQNAELGKCWTCKMTMQGCVLTIRTARPVKPAAIVLDHVSQLSAMNNDVGDAPRIVEVYGLRQNDDFAIMQKTATKLITFEFNAITASRSFINTQRYPVISTSDAEFEFIQVRILSNWRGDSDHSCVYHIGVEA